MIGMLGCGTAYLVCGCSLSTSMFGEGEKMGLYICNRHLQIPEVQEAKVADVWEMILAYDVRTDEEKEW